ncbi:MAG: tRNA 2-thiouridine(34) synthase MnmA [Gammaproteobacteria bacterium]|nr:MAG: tRNA 2-thiouridine(34) synthase MnmA [Gammaproteobacteria bacterium]
MTNKIIVGMSGGVDSSVSAHLLQKQDLKVEGLFMKNWEEDDDEEYCSASVDLADAQNICDQIGIPLHTVNFSSEYWDRVFEYFLTEYKAGRTPNPDIICNKEIKFRAFLDHALNLDADYIATGHYANCDISESEALLFKGLDSNKDQSYFLHTLDQQQLSKTLFPIGKLEKSEVRSIAKQNGLDTYDKKDSTGICFIGERKFRDFLKNYIPAQHGEIRTLDDKVIGKHEGVMFYTIGQRQGLGIGGQREHSEEPWYVTEKNIDANYLYVVQGREHKSLYHSKLLTQEFHWIAGKPPASLDNLKAKTRYRQSDQACSIQQASDTGYEITFTEPQWAITPGQSVVLYQDDNCLGGAIIEKRFN